MNKYSKIVLWVGLFLIAMTVVTNWSLLHDAIFVTPEKQRSSAEGGPIPKVHGKCPAGTMPVPGTNYCQRIPTPPLGH